MKNSAREILNESKTKPEGNNADSKFSKRGKDETVTFRKREIRKADPQNPPYAWISRVQKTIPEISNFHIWIYRSGTLNFKTPSDTLFLYDPFYYRPDLHSTIRSDGEQIIFQGLFGLTRSICRVNIRQTIWKNETGIKFFGSGVGMGWPDFFGVHANIPVSLLNGILFYLSRWAYRYSHCNEI